MSSIHPDLQNLSLAAKSLTALKSEIVFVGGATAILYVDDQNSTELRPTVDVDLQLLAQACTNCVLQPS